MFAKSLFAFSFADSLYTTVYFRCGSSMLDLSYHDNISSMEIFLSNIRSIRKNDSLSLRHIYIVSGASVDGGVNINEKLSKQRALQVRSYLQEKFSFPDSMFSISSLGQDWNGLHHLVESSDMPYRSEVLAILYNILKGSDYNNVIVEKYKHQLIMLHNGSVWHYMLKHFMPLLRRSMIDCKIERVIYNQPEITTPVENTSEKKDSLQKNRNIHDTTTSHNSILSTCINNKTTCYYALRSNLLYNIALIPNIGLEFYLGKNWSIGGNWQYAWWKNDKHHKYWRIYGGDVEIRKYFNTRSTDKFFTGHHVGLYLQGLTYDVELGKRGYLSKFSYGIGVEYGYSLPLYRQFNLDFSVGIGYLAGKYKQYTPVNNHYVWKQTNTRHWFGPTKAGISLIWLLKRNCCNKKKGGTL